MKINLTLEISDDLRRVMGKLPNIKTNENGLAVRQHVVELIKSRVDEWNTDTKGFTIPEPITSDEMEDFKDAVDYMKAIGVSDTDIKRWIFKQRARRTSLNQLLART